MLNIKDVDAITDENLKQVVVDLRRTHVSRFPIDVVAGGDGYQVKFMDSRFPNDHFRFKDNKVDASVAFAWREGYDKDMKPIYKVYSRLIQNDRYSAYNDDYNTRTTSDVRKLAKILRECVKPFSALEITARTAPFAREAFDHWKETPQREYQQALRNMYAEEWMDIFNKLFAQGIAPVTPKHEAIYQNAIPAYIEHQERKNKFSQRIHVFINPDATVQVTKMHTEKETHLYDSFESVPEDIRQQVAMLQISETKQYVGNVGVKMSDTEFWVDAV